MKIKWDNLHTIFGSTPGMQQHSIYINYNNDDKSEDYDFIAQIPNVQVNDQITYIRFHGTY